MAFAAEDTRGHQLEKILFWDQLVFVSCRSGKKCQQLGRGHQRTSERMYMICFIMLVFVPYIVCIYWSNIDGNVTEMFILDKKRHLVANSDAQNY